MTRITDEDLLLLYRFISINHRSKEIPKVIYKMAKILKDNNITSESKISYLYP